MAIGKLEHFNSRPSARGDLHLFPRQRPHLCRFQFTPLREGRQVVALLVAEVLISIHAPPRGATRNRPKRATARRISIHAPPRGATFRDVRESGRRENFNSRPSARGDDYRVIRSGSATVFQFTPLREGRPGNWQDDHQRKHFNSRPSARGDCGAFRHNRITLHFNSRPSARGDADCQRV